MKIKQIRISRSVKYFAEKVKAKFNLLDFSDINAPVVMYGLYNEDDLLFYEKHKPYIIVLWRGTDAKILNKRKADIIKAKTNVRHISGSKSVRNSLLNFRIKSEIIPVTPTSVIYDSTSSGKCVYCYVGNIKKSMRDKYRYGWLLKLKNILPYKFIITTLNQYTDEELKEVYEKCFVGVRLLDHDGLSNTILELGLMGRKTISNSGLPHTISWKTLSDVNKAIINEYSIRNKNNTSVSKDFKDFLNIGDKWLELE